MNILISAVQYEVTGFVQKSIERSLYVRRDYLQKWVSNPPTIEFKRKVDARKKEDIYGTNRVNTTGKDCTRENTRINKNFRATLIFLLWIIDIRSNIRSKI
jgi:hypothetical protein